MKEIKTIQDWVESDDDYVSNSIIEDEEFDKFMKIHRLKNTTRIFVTPNLSSNDERTYVLKKNKK